LKVKKFWHIGAVKKLGEGISSNFFTMFQKNFRNHSMIKLILSFRSYIFALQLITETSYFNKVTCPQLEGAQQEGSEAIEPRAWVK